MADLIDALEDAIRKHCADAMRDHSQEDVDALASDSLVGEYASWRVRFPSVRRRAVHESKELAQSPHLGRYADGIAAITRDLRRGVDLTPYLSSQVRFADGQDLLLAHSGLHHLHMSDALGKWGRKQRTEHVLFVGIQPEDAYLIDIYAHPSDGANWSEIAMLEILARNWDGAGILHAAQYATGVTQHFDDAARQALQAAGVNVIVEIDGRVWMTLGASLTGKPFTAMRMGMKVRAELDSLRARGLVALLTDLHRDFPEVPIGGWEPAVYENRSYGFFSEQHKLVVPYGDLTLP